MRTTRRRTRLATLACALLAGIGATVPGTASATLPTQTTSDVNWNLRHGWVDYLTNPAWSLWTEQGALTPTGSPAPTADPSGGFTSWDPDEWENTAYGWVFDVAADSGTPRTVALNGGLAFDMDAHDIHVTLTDIRVVDNGSGTEVVKLDGTYDPVSGSDVSVDDITFANVSSAGAVTLTAAGAAMFNGGSNGSYSAGSAFGTLSYAS